MFLILSQNSDFCAVVRDPPKTSLWPPIYFVVECITMSAPNKIGFCKAGEAKVLSTAKIKWFDLQILPRASISVILSSGFDGVSAQIITVFGFIKLSTLDKSVKSIKSIANTSAKIVCNCFLNPQYISSGAII